MHLKMFKLDKPSHRRGNCHGLASRNGHLHGGAERRLLFLLHGKVAYVVMCEPHMEEYLAGRPKLEHVIVNLDWEGTEQDSRGLIEVNKIMGL